MLAHSRSRQNSKAGGTSGHIVSDAQVKKSARTMTVFMTA
jgi:hypothetical protein